MIFVGEALKMYFSETKSVANTIIVETLTTKNYQRWDDFVSEEKFGSFFHLSKWKTFYEDFFDLETFYFFAHCAGKIVGILPAARVKSYLFGDAIISTPFCVYGGVIGTSQAKILLINKIKEIATELNVDYIELRQQENFIQEGWAQNIYVYFKKKIASDEENLKEIPRKQRAIIRKSLKNELTHKTQNNVDDFYHLYSTSVRNLGTPVQHKIYYKSLLDYFPDNTNILTVFHKKIAISSVLNFYYKNEVLPYYGGGGEEARHLKANDFMYWALMCEASKQGVETFDFGRSKINSGSYRFKKHWGFEPTPLYYSILPIKTTAMPDLNPTNKKYQLMIQTWKKLPLQISQIIGPFIAKSLG